MDYVRHYWIDGDYDQLVAVSLLPILPKADEGARCTTIAAGLGRDRESEDREQVSLLRDIVGNPFKPQHVEKSILRWRSRTVSDMARSIYDKRSFAALPVLGDALEDAGCTNADILAHCRGPGPHVRGCWVVDLLLGKS
jgi:hypothetical protein